MKKTFITFAISFCFLYACNNSNNSAGREEALVSDSLLQQNNAPSISSTPVQMPATIDSGTTETPVGAPPSSPPGQVASISAGMNPAHGEPNHRCDIPVGAPLNSPPTKTPAPSPNSPVTPSISPAPALTPSSAPGNASVTTPTTTAPGMNPPHGQPGHDCAIPVGAPLKK